MSFGKSGDTNPETAPIRMRARFVKFANELHEVDRVLKDVSRFVISTSARRISTECENVTDRGLCVTLQNRLDFVMLVADARQVQNRIELRRCLNALDQVVRELARGPAGAVGDADKVRHVRLQ